MQAVADASTTSAKLRIAMQYHPRKYLSTM